MDLVQMERVGDCGIACLAMVMGLSLNEARRARGYALGEMADKVGITDAEMVEVLRKNGYSARVVTDRPDYRPCILVVPSLNHRGLLHYVVWDGGRYLDPSPGPLRYPDDGPDDPNGGGRMVCWASAIVWDER